MSPGLGLLVTVFLLVGLAFFVVAEYALVRVRETQLVELAERGNRLAILAQRMVRALDEYVSAIQVGITATNLGLGVVGEPLVSDLLISAVPALVAVDPGLAHTLAFAVSFALVTFAALLLGEVAPRYLALEFPLRLTLVVALPLYWFNLLVRPLVWAVTKSARGIVRPLGVRGLTYDQAYTEEELRLLLAASARAGVLQESERELLHNVLEFADKMVRQVMVPRTEVVAVEAAATVQDIVELAGKHPYTRFPVYRDDLDHVVGVVHLRDVVSLPPEALRRTRVTGVMRRVVAVPETMRLDRALAEMRLQRTPLFLVIDEFGGTAGLVTMEDVLEELVGELQDEFDRAAPQVRTAPDGSLVIDGLTSLADVRDRLGLVLEGEPYDTIGGLVFGRLGRIAKLGDVVEIEGVRFEVTAMDGRRVAQVRARRGPRPAVRAG